MGVGKLMAPQTQWPTTTADADDLIDYAIGRLLWWMSYRGETEKRAIVLREAAKRLGYDPTVD